MIEKLAIDLSVKVRVIRESSGDWWAYVDMGGNKRLNHVAATKEEALAGLQVKVKEALDKIWW